MSRYLRPRLKLYRREGTNLFLKNRFKFFDKKYSTEDNLGSKKVFDKLPTHYSYQLRERQKLKIIYGVLNKQFYTYYLKSKKIGGNLAENILHLLESRLDNVVYRLGFATTRSEARQIVNHKCILVNNKITNIPSKLVNIGDIIKVRDKCKKQIRIINSLDLYKKTVIFD